MKPTTKIRFTEPQIALVMCAHPNCNLDRLTELCFEFDQAGKIFDCIGTIKDGGNIDHDYAGGGLVTLGEGDPGLLAARPKMPRRPQPRRIGEASGAHTHYAAARLAIQPTCTIRAHEPAVQPTAIRDALECSGFTRSKAEARVCTENLIPY